MILSWFRLIYCNRRITAHHAISQQHYYDPRTDDVRIEDACMREERSNVLGAKQFECEALRLLMLFSQAQRS
jgi:hypothetical protein